MPIPTLFLLFATAWALFHLAKRSPAVRRRVRSLWRARPSPPTLGLDLATHLDDLDDDDESRWTVKTTLVGVQISTTVLNELPARLVGQLSDKSTTRLERAYDLGVVWGALGTLATVVILAWEGAGLAVWIIKLMSKSGGGPEVGRVVRRSIEETTTATASGPAFGQGIIQPLIPGVTLPLSHASYLLLSFLLGQIVHEPGHVIAGALSSLAPLLASVHLSPILPSASVTLPSTALRDLPAQERARIAAAGCWHNLVFAVLVWASAATVEPWTRGQFVGDVGRGVLGVQEQSSLHSVLPRGAIITQLDDVSLAADSVVLSDDIWSSYLTEPTPLALTQAGRVEPHRGWCVPKEWYLNQPPTCSSRLDPSLVLFNPVSSAPTSASLPTTSHASSTSHKSPTDPRLSDSDDSDARCLPLHPVLTSTLFDPPSLHYPVPPPSPPPSPYVGFAHCPCQDSKKEMCIALDPKNKIVRILFFVPARGGGSGGERKWIIWQGERDQIFLQVTSSALLPPFPILLSPLFHHLVLFKAYFLLISLTLAIFNLLPLPILDGGMLLEAFLDWADGEPGDARGEEDEMELLERSRGEEQEDGERRSASGRWKRWERTVHWGVGGLGVWVLGGVGVRMLVGG